MKLKTLALVTMTATILSCKNRSTDNQHTQDSNSFIPVDSANKMLTSYLTSIDNPQSEGSLKSLIIDASALRSYLNNTENGEINKVKIMFAHTLEYINSGHEGQNAGYQSGALTLIIAGYDDEGNYIYNHENKVLDNGAGCPINCPSGEAGNELLIK